MASSELKKAKNSSLIESDMLSNLPEDVKEKILTYLPIKEAGRTSILSSKWRYIWASIPELSFGDTKNISDLVEFVDSILLLHDGPIRKFNLFTTIRYCKAFDRWIVNLSRNGIRKLALKIDLINREYTMHSRFFSCDELNYVNLYNCSFKVPSNFKGFKLLHTLEITWSTVSDDDLENLVSSCPLLKKLKLKDLWNCSVINIRAPNLQSLVIYSDFCNLQLCAPKLHSLCVGLRCPRESLQHSGESVLPNLPNLVKLELIDHSLAYLCDEPFWERFSWTFNRLKDLDLLLDFAEEKESAFVLTLFRGAPHLQVLNIDVCFGDHATSPIPRFWERVDRNEDMLKELRTVNIVEFRAVDAVLLFVKFILGSAPQLETMEMEEHANFKGDERMMYRQLLQFERASPKAKILFE